MAEETQTNGSTPNEAAPGMDQLTKEEVRLIAASFQGKCCPLGLIGLSMAGAVPQQGGLVSPLGLKVGGQQAGGELVGCQGPTCMWFRIIKHPPEKEGGRPQVIGGDCTIPMTLGAIAALPGNIGGVLAQLGKFRFTPS
jgi:hypothetical protein